MPHEHVDIPKDVLTDSTAFAWPPKLDLSGYRPVPDASGSRPACGHRVSVVDA